MAEITTLSRKIAWKVALVTIFVEMAQRRVKKFLAGYGYVRKFPFSKWRKLDSTSDGSSHATNSTRNLAKIDFTWTSFPLLLEKWAFRSEQQQSKLRVNPKHPICLKQQCIFFFFFAWATVNAICEVFWFNYTVLHIALKQENSWSKLVKTFDVCI